MSDKKFSEFTLQTDSSNVAFVVGFNGSDNVRISPSNLIGSGFLPTSGGTMTGNLLLQDNIQVQVGTGGDLKLYHNGTDSFIENQTGILKIQSSVVDGDISFLADNGSGTPTEYFRLDGSVTLNRFYKNVRLDDNIQLQVGSGADLQIYHNGTNSYMSNSTGDFYIEQLKDDGDIIFKSDNGSGGTAEYFRLDGGNGNIITSVNNVFADDKKVCVGSSADLQIFHTGGDSLIKNTVGNLYIQNETDDGDIYFQADNGSGSNTTYFFLNGDDTNTNFQLDTLHPDNVKAKFGTSADLRIYHNGTNSNIENFTGTLQIIQNLDNGDISFKTDDGSGGTTEYFRIDGQYELNRFTKNARFVDGVKANFGTTDDLQIYHSSGSNIIDSTVGDLIVKVSQDDGDIIFQSDDGSGGVTAYLTLDGSDTRIKIPDNINMTFGAGGDLQLSHDATDSLIRNYTGDLKITNFADDKDIIFQSDDGSGGVTEYFKLWGLISSILISKDVLIGNDTAKLKFGASQDLEIYHDGSDNFYNGTTGDMYFINKADDKDIIFQTDNGSGGYTTYFYLDGAFTKTIFSRDIWAQDNVKALFGTSSDLQIYHDGSHSFISDQGTGNLQILATNLQINNSGNTQNMITASDGGAVTLYTAGNAKLATTSSGVDVTGRMAINDGNDNLLFGDAAGDALTTGTSNIAIGTNALSAEDTGTRSVAIGEGALQLQNNDNNNYNIAIGHHAGNVITTGTANTIIGGLAGDALTTGSNNVAIGYQALSTEDTQGLNVAIGSYALLNLNAGSNAYNVAVGYNSGQAMTTGVQNTIVGGMAGDALTTGQFNVAIGTYALTTEDTGSRVVAIGFGALANANNDSDNYNVAVGYEAGNDITTGVRNTIMGGLAGDALTTGSNNVAIGYAALSGEDANGRNVAIGAGALYALNAGTEAYNIAIGYDAGGSVTTGVKNTIIGGLAGSALTTGEKNIAIGYNALTTEDTGDRSVAIGHGALRYQNNDASNYNTAVGYDAGTNVTTGVSNTILGGQAGDALTTGSYSVAIGHLALGTEDTSGANVAVGYKALFVQDGGTNNTSVGYQSAMAITTGDENTVIGSEAGSSMTTATNCAVIGYNAEPSAAGAADEITLGDANVDTLRCATQTISALSDERDKTNIQESTYGLDFIEQLNPVTFDWNTRDGSRKGKKDLGFIAQELDAVDDEYTQLVYKSNPDKLEASYGRLVPVLVKAIQELKQEIQQLKNK